MTYPDGRIIFSGYDLLDRLTGARQSRFLQGASRAGAVPFSANPLPFFFSPTYYPPGELNTAVYGLSVQVTTAFNKRQNLTSLTYSHSSTQTLWSKSYAWDRNAENLLSVKDQISGKMRSFTYDNVNRLISATDSSGGISDTYTMDAWGNRQESGTFNFIQPFSSANRISATGYVYDSSGNLMADGLGNTYTYDADGKMSASNGATYTRDPFGQRVRKDYGGAATEYFYFGGALLATRDPSSGQGTDYVYAGGRLIAEIPVAPGSSDFPVYRLGDHLDSLAQKTDAVGNLLGTNDVSPYGELFSSTASDRLLFTQHERDAENGNDSALYRQYASTQGRWLSPDPYNGSYNLVDPQSLNRYAYLGGRPLAGVDPDGLFLNGLGDGGDDGGGFGGFLDLLCGLFGGGGGGHRAGPPSTVDTGYGNPNDPNGSVINPPYVLQQSSDPGSLGESLGIPKSIPHGVWGIGPALGLPSSCEFGVCSAGPGAFGGGGGNPTTQIQSLYENILEHLEKIAADPNNPAVQHWRAEIENWTKQIVTKAGKRPGSLDKYLQRIIGISGSDLQNLLPSPVIVVNPCIIDPLAPYCGRGRYNGPA